MKWIRNVALVLLALLLVVLGVQLIRWNRARHSDPAATFIKPRVLVTKLRITDHDPDATRMVLELQLVNPAPIGFALDSLRYSLGIEDAEVIHSSYAKALHVPAYDTAAFSFPVVVDSKKLIERLKQLDEQGLDSVHYTMDVLLHAAILDKPVEIKTSVHAPLFKLPKVAFSDPRLGTLGLKHTGITLDMAMYNPNVFPFGFKDMKLKLRMGEDQVFETRIDTTVLVPRQDTAVVRLRVELAVGQLIAAAFSALVKPAKTPFSYDLSLTIVSDEPAISNSAFIMTGKGVVADLEQ